MRLFYHLLLFIIYSSNISYGCGRPSDCGSNRSGCCGNSSEWKTSTRRAFEGKIREKATELREKLEKSINTFKIHLSSSIIRSHRHLDSLFSTTYGIFYEKHTKIFADLFSDLNIESLHEEVQITDVVTPFYRRLFRVVFTILNPMVNIGIEEAECMGRSMDELNPFGDIPSRSIIHLERTLQGWRQLILSMQTAHEALARFTNASLSSTCVDALTKMSICPSCSSDTPLMVCRPVCEATLSSCMNEWIEMDGQWNTLIGWLGRLTLRMKDAYSLSSTLDALPSLISEAIMIFQEKREEISNKVSSKCIMNEDRLRRFLRGKRSIEDNKKRRMNIRQITVETETQQRATVRMIEQLYEKLGEMRGFFSNLPKDICENEKISADNGDKCWNNEGIELMKKESIEEGEHPFRGRFVHEGVRFGLLSFRIATFIYGRNYTGYTIEGSGNIIDDEDYWESSGDNLSILQLDKPSQSNIKVYPSHHSSSSSSISLLSWIVVFLLSFIH